MPIVRELDGHYAHRLHKALTRMAHYLCTCPPALAIHRKTLKTRWKWVFFHLYSAAPGQLHRLQRHMSQSTTTLRLSLLSLGIACVCSGCAQMNVRQAAYEFLSAEDCRRNQVDEFCNRSYHHEFKAYEQLREEYLRGTIDPEHWRVNTPPTS